MPIEKLDHLSVLEITGQDALTFLQGQLTNDINMANNQWQYSGYCNPKGRLLGLFSLWCSGDAVYALIDNSLIESLTKRLKMYVMRSKVDINTAPHSILAVSGEPELLALAPETSSEQIQNNNSTTTVGENHILSYGNRYLYITTQETAINNAHVIQKNKSQWHAKNITQGLPEVTSSSTELFIPQMLNLDLINGINFKKGCYTGQEIVARMHYLGKLKQRMFLCNLSNPDTQVKPGDKIFSEETLSKNIGTIVSINDHHALAVLKLDHLEQTETKMWLNIDTTINTNKNQPYSLKPAS